MKQVRIIFRLHRDNRYSILALLAAIEQLSKTPVETFLLPDSSKDNGKVLFDILNKSRTSLTLIAYSFMSTRWKEVAREWKLIKSRQGNAKQPIIIAGGPHPTGAVKQILASGADYVCAGEGEHSIVSLIYGLAEGNLHANLYGNIYYLKNNKPTKIGGTQSISMAWEEMFPFPTNPRRFSPIEITRGCPFKCKYCETPVIKGTKVRHKALHVILDSIKLMIKHNKTDIRFITPNALSYGSQDGKKPALDKLYELLSNIRRILPPAGRIFFGSFPSEIRPEFVTEETMKIMKEFCDNKQVVVGAQSGSSKMLDIMRRGHSVEDVLKACELLTSHGFTPSVDFIFGLPYEQEEDMYASIKIIKELVSMGAKIHAHAFMPLPGSRWSCKNPTPIPQFVRRYLESLIANGKLFGQWMHQEQISKELKN